LNLKNALSPAALNLTNLTDSHSSNWRLADWLSVVLNCNSGSVVCNSVSAVFMSHCVKFCCIYFIFYFKKNLKFFIFFVVLVSSFFCVFFDFQLTHLPFRQTAKGRTNVELREQFTLAAGVSQSMTPFKSKPSFSGPSPDASVSGSSGQRPSVSGPITKVGSGKTETGRLFCFRLIPEKNGNRDFRR
jgi:hypothetical protein